MAPTQVRLFLSLFLVLVPAGAEQATEVCSSQISGTQVAVQTSRSSTGNWVTKVDLERGGGRGQDSMRTEPWSVAVDSNTRSCEGAESRLHVTLTLTAPLGKVGSDYELFPGVGYFKFHTQATTWPLARQQCAEEGAHLAIINSEAEADVMKQLFVKHPDVVGGDNKDFAWIGLEKKAGGFFTIFGDALNTTGFTRWQPSVDHTKMKDDHCMLVGRSAGGLTYHTCVWKVPFICEHEI